MVCNLVTVATYRNVGYFLTSEEERVSKQLTQRNEYLIANKGLMISYVLITNGEKELLRHWECLKFLYTHG